MFCLYKELQQNFRHSSESHVLAKARMESMNMGDTGLEKDSVLGA